AGVSSSTSASASAAAILSCPGSNGISYIAANGVSYTVQCYTGHSAGDMSMSYQPRLESCIAACESTSGCVVVSWVPGSPSGPCYLKSSAGAAVSNGGAWGALKATATSSTPSSLPSSTSIGFISASSSTFSLANSTISASSSASPSSSTSTCPNGISSTTLSCPSSNGTCHKTPSSALFAIECSTDRYGNDLSLSWEASLESCLAT
ncbi:hypothetical protein AOQ84DRAFT_402234, partial [Glonium stellatum]